MERGKDVMDIDRALTRALDADDPGPAFAGKVIAAVKAATAGAAPATVSRSGLHAIQWRAVLPIAATVALVVAGARYQAIESDRAAQAAEAQREETRARAAHAQLVQALRLTGQQLNVVHRAIERSQTSEPGQTIERSQE